MMLRTRLAALLAASALILVACDAKSPPSQPSAPQSPIPAAIAATTQSARPPSAADPMAGAPTELRDMLRWSETQLQTGPPAVPLPNHAKLPQPRKPIIRLLDSLAKAESHSAWKPTDKKADSALLSIGPFRSDQPQADRGFGTRAFADPDEGECLLLTFSGLNLPREEIGSIQVDIKIPFGSFFDFRWGKGCNARIPVTQNKDFVTIDVTTEGFAEWSGPLQILALMTEGKPADGQVVELRSIRFIGQADSFPDPVGFRRAKLNREIRSSAYAHAPAEIVFPECTIPPNARFSAGLGLVGHNAAAGTAAGEISGEVLIEINGQRRSVAKQVAASPDAWFELAADLSEFAGAKARLVLKADGKQPTDIAIWGNPTIYESQPDAPIVILYLVDTLSAQHLDLYGYNRATAPNIAGLAAQGVWFENMRAPSSATVTSVPCLLLGITSERHRVVHSSAVAPNELVSMADAMRAAGFATLSAVTNTNAGPRQNMDQGFDTFIDRMTFHWSEGADRTVPIDEIKQFMQRNADLPQFIYVHTAEPHGPYTPPPGFAGKFDTGYRGPLKGTYDRKEGFFAAKTPAEIAHIVSLYDEEVVYADHRFGLFLHMIEEIGLRARANVFLTADHGEEFMQHGGWVHGLTLYEECTRVPLVAAGPLISARGKESATADLLDIMPTLLDMFELPEPYLLSGRSLLPALRTGPDKLANKLAIASSYGMIRANLIHWTLVENNRWKLMYGPTDNSFKYPDGKLNRWWLFDLQTDPSERRSVMIDNEPVARRLVAALLANFHRQRPYDVGAEHDLLKYDADQLRELKSLGYIGE